MPCAAPNNSLICAYTSPDRPPRLWIPEGFQWSRIAALPFSYCDCWYYCCNSTPPPTLTTCNYGHQHGIFFPNAAFFPSDLCPRCALLVIWVDEAETLMRKPANTSASQRWYRGWLNMLLGSGEPLWPAGCLKPNGDMRKNGQPATYGSICMMPVPGYDIQPLSNIISHHYPSETIIEILKAHPSKIINLDHWAASLLLSLILTKMMNLFGLYRLWLYKLYSM